MGSIRKNHPAGFVKGNPVTLSSSIGMRIRSALLVITLLFTGAIYAQPRPYTFQVNAGASAGINKLYGLLGGEIHYRKNSFGLTCRIASPATTQRLIRLIYPPLLGRKDYTDNFGNTTYIWKSNSHFKKNFGPPAMVFDYNYYPGNRYTPKGVNNGFYFGCSFSLWWFRFTETADYAVPNGDPLTYEADRQFLLYTGGLQGGYRFFFGKHFTTDIKLGVPFYVPYERLNSSNGSPFEAAEAEAGVTLGLCF